MIVVRDVFTAKPGQASKLAKKFRAGHPADAKIRILTDVIGQYNTVILEWEFASLGDWEKLLEDYKAGNIPPQMADAMQGYTDMYLTGHREILQIVE